ncbi:glycine cleavage system aminomethyltransferase GcvT [Caldilinea sp.]|uniref:glycine cleavage system aminomethyltransferase GcvT n=1 Tax=Caldilinea sp. TaxID=2293560 RepID=UPI0021DE09DB|nr:glycine cleavage system aminomethyltransferase GcvT [Caldilinea sp.]GIV67508.1 MAG: aminomethyltransferase [Caldilinea sp.]
MLQRTPLYEIHVALGGRMVEFAGFELPVQYPTGPTAEHHAVRAAAGLFDIDHMGQFELAGPDVVEFLQQIQVWDVEQMAEGDAHYSLLCYEDGTVVDDIFLYRLSGRWLMVVNAANRAKDWAWIEHHLGRYDVALIERSDDLAMLALQGPKAEQILQKLTDYPLHTVATRTAIETQIGGLHVIAGRTGYTGEDGFELYAPVDRVIDFWNQLLEAGKEEGLLPCGLAARDSLRFEACLPLYGHELSAKINPLEARLGWTISWSKPFIGRDALLKVRLEKPERLLVGLEMIDKAVPREGYPVAVDGKVIGHVTSGMKSPTLGKFLAMAYVPAEHSAIGAKVDVIVRGEPKQAVVVKRPFYKPRYK